VATTDQKRGIAGAVRYQPNLVAISAGMRAHLATARALIEPVRAVVPGATLMVGGIAFAQAPDLWRALGADIYHPDTVAAVDLATDRLLRENPTSRDTKSQ
jgi:MerR family transcriptional regulator, light-induced transcriptional regulator